MTYNRAQYLPFWLLLGPIPESWDTGLDEDFLISSGGEAAIRAKEGQVVRLPDGSEKIWKKLNNPEKIIDLEKFYKGDQTENVVCYAYGIINREEAGKSILALGSDDGIKVWLNGKLLERKHVYRSVRIDEDILPVDLKKGENYLLLKIQQYGYSWGFTARTTEDANVPERAVDYLPVTTHDIPGSPEFIIRTPPLVNTITKLQPVSFIGYGAGGDTVFQKTILRGDSVVVNDKNWPDGIYEIKYTYTNLNGLTVSSYLNRYKGDVMKMVRELVNTAPGKDAVSPKDITQRMLADLLLEKFNNNVYVNDSSKFYWIYNPLMEFAEMNANKQIRPGGFIRLAYIDETDGTPQFCRCYIPPGYDPSKKTPMVVYLHGYNQDNPEYINWWSAIEKRHDPLVDRYNCVLIEPHGRGNAQYRGFADKDVTRCIQMTKNILNIDEDRVYLTGESMGGGGTWLVAATHPGLFAAIAPVYGGWDYHVYMNPEDIASMTKAEKFLREKNNTTCQLDALLNTPILALHGDHDGVVSVENTRYIVRMLQRWGYDVRYIEVPGKNHENLGMGDVIYPWLLKHTRNKNPRKVKVRAAALSTASAWWLNILQYENNLKIMNAEAVILENNIISVNSDNVLQMVLTPGKDLINYDKPVNVIWNGEIYTFDHPADDTLLLNSKNLRTGENHKTPLVAGPEDDFVNTPFALVVGTISTDSTMRKVIEMKKDAFVKYWKDWQKFEPRIFTDTTISDSDLEKYSLFLLGGPHENRITQQITESLPFRIDTNAITIQGKLFNAPDAVLETVYPSPFNAKRYIRLVAPTSFKGMFFYEPVNGDEAVYDFTIRDGRIFNPALSLGSENKIIARGIYDPYWQVDTSCLEMAGSDINSFARQVVNKNLEVEIVPLTIPASSLQDACTNTYKSVSNNFTFKILKNENQLYFRYNEKDFEIKPISGTEFLIPAFHVILSFQKDTETGETFINFYGGGHPVKCLPVSL